MAAGRSVHTQKNRVNRQGQYVYGNVVTKPSYEPQRRTSAPKRKKNVSRRVSQNRKKALGYEPCLCNISCGGSNICTDPVRELCADAVKNYKSFKRSKFLAEGACRFEGAEQYEV